MAWFSTSTTGSPSTRAEARQRLESIRTRMADLCRSGGARKESTLALRIHYAPDVKDLWFMRSELMAMLARSHGEVAAREQLARLSAMFEGLLPEGLRSRPSPLDELGGHDAAEGAQGD